MSLVSILRNILSPEPQLKDLHNLVSVCHRIASTYLKQKVNSGRLSPSFFGLTVDDLALDCIADLFKRDVNGQLIHFQEYFEDLIFQLHNDDEAFIYLRRLLFSKINHSLFRSYNVENSSLSRIIRNLKRSLKVLPHIHIDNRYGEVYLYLTYHAGALPIMPQEFLQSRLHEKLEADDPIHKILEAAMDIIQDQNEYRKEYPFIGLAAVISSYFKTLGSTSVEVDSDSDLLREEEILRLIKDSINVIHQGKINEYVHKHKLTTDEYQLFFDAVKEILIAQYVRNDGYEYSYYEYLRKLMEGLTEKRYSLLYRSSFEYIVRLTRNELVKKMRDEIR